MGMSVIGQLTRLPGNSRAGNTQFTDAGTSAEDPVAFQSTTQLLAHGFSGPRGNEERPALDLWEPMARNVDDLIRVKAVQLRWINRATNHNAPTTFHALENMDGGGQPLAFRYGGADDFVTWRRSPRS